MHITSKLIHNHHQKRNNNWNPRSSNIFRIMQAGKLKTNNSTPKKRENIDTKNQYNSSRLLPPFIYSLHQTEVSSQEESKRGTLNFKHTDDQSNHDHFKLKKIKIKITETASLVFVQHHATNLALYGTILYQS